MSSTPDTDVRRPFGNAREARERILRHQMSNSGNEQMDPHMQRFLEEEKRKAVFNEVVAQLANACFEKCVTSPSAKLTSYEATCLSNCALRYMESGQVILSKMQQG